MTILNTEHCLRRIPQKLRTWVQPSISQAYDAVDVSWIRINKRSGNRSPAERTLLAFWTHDREFEEFLRLFRRRVMRLVESSVRMAVTPDISICWDDSSSEARAYFTSQLEYGRRMQ